MWKVEATNLATGQAVRSSCHILVHATGYLNNPAWPNIPGLDAYTGSKLHSADYDDSVSLHGKDVLLIGGGSSAVQILPTIQPIAKSVKIFIRSPVWVLPDISNEAGQYSQEEIDNFVSNAESVQALRQNNERTMNSIFSRSLVKQILRLRSILMQTSSCIFKGLIPAEAMSRTPGVRDEKNPAGQGYGGQAHP